MSRELETVALWRDGGGGLWMGRSGPERPWNWLTGTDASPDDLLSGGSRKVEESFGRIDPDDVRPTVVPEKLRTLDHGRPWSDDQFASTRLSSNRDMSR